MGCDIHWIIERRVANGSWHVVDSKDRLFHARWDQSAGFDQFSKPVFKIGDRDYALFGILSEVRGEPLDEGPLMTPGLPEDASQAACTEEEENGDGHSWGWADGATILGWRSLGNDVLDHWLDDLEAYMSGEEIGQIIPPMCIINDEWTYPDIAGIETGHEAVERSALSETLIDWKSDPSAWRVIIFFDN